MLPTWQLAELFFFFFFAKHIIVGRLFRNIYPWLQYSSRSLIHASLYYFFSSLTCTSCTVPLPLVTVYTMFVFRLFTIKHFGAWADFQIIIMDNGRKALVFLYILKHIFAINITFIRLVLTFPQLCCFIPNKTTIHSWTTPPPLLAFWVKARFRTTSLVLYNYIFITFL